MGKVGIIANPAASKDIRRLVAQGRVIPDWEKVNIVRRVLIGLQAVGIEQVVAMPDSSHICPRARDDSHLTLGLSLLEMPTYHTEGDTVRAAAQMGKEGVTCLVTLGGDGTNRAVACGSNSIPIVPISTGTNNVFPQMIEGTLAGLAAGLVADGSLQPELVSTISKTLAVYVDGDYRDLALVDVALSRERYVATRAIWDMSTLYEVFLTRAESASIGLSSVGARLQRLTMNDAGALRYVLAESGGQDREQANITSMGDNPTAGQDKTSVLAPIAPGMVTEVAIAYWQRLAEGERLAVEPRHSAVALDGERAFTVTPRQSVEISVQRNGPPVVHVERALQVASELGLFKG